MKPRKSSVIAPRGLVRILFGKILRLGFHLRKRGSRWLANGFCGVNVLLKLRKVMVVLRASIL
jgi:hypothetical protein